MPDELSVRQWQERFRAGVFDSRETAVQREAGWWNWHCRDDALAGRLKRIAPVITGIESPLILDHCTVWFANERTENKLLYDSVRFELLNGPINKVLFMVDFNDPRQPDKWSLYTKRFGFHAPEFCCSHVRDMTAYIDKTSHELEQGIISPFLAEKAAAEKAAAVEYILHRPVTLPSRALRRESEHSYSFLDRDDGRRKTVHVAHSLKDVPSEFVSRVRESGGLYVYCPEDAGKDLPAPRKAEKKSHKKKEAER